jgi:hypothetical protein
MPSRLGIIVEGPDDASIISQILGKLKTSFKIREARGSGNLKRKLPSYIELLRSSGCTKIIILRDLDCMDYEAVCHEFARYITDVTKLCLAVHELESWLLADHIALSEVLHRPINTINDPESFHDAKLKMKKIFEQSGKNYIPSRDLPKIAEHLNLSAVRERCQSYRGFEGLVRDC